MPCSSLIICEMLPEIQVPKMKIAKFANRVDPDEAAHHELPHLDLHCTLLAC